MAKEKSVFLLSAAAFRPKLNPAAPSAGPVEVVVDVDAGAADEVNLKVVVPPKIDAEVVGLVGDPLEAGKVDMLEAVRKIGRKQ